MGKTQHSVSIPKKYWKKYKELYEKLKDVCEELEISSPSELVRVLMRLGEPRFREIVEHTRRTRKKTPSN